MDTTANGNSHHAAELSDAFEAFDAAGYEEEDVLFGYDPQVLYDNETGEVRIIVVVPLEDGGEQPIHIPLDDEGMVAVVNGLAEARGVQPRMAARGPLVEELNAPTDAPPRSAIRRMVDPAGIGGLTPDDLPPTIFGVQSNRMIAYILIGVLVISFLLMILL